MRQLTLYFKIMPQHENMHIHTSSLSSRVGSGRSCFYCGLVMGHGLRWVLGPLRPAG